MGYDELRGMDQDQLRSWCINSVRRVMTHFQSRIVNDLAKSRKRAERRKRAGWPVVAICGQGGCGKGEAANVLSRLSPLKYPGGTSWTAAPFIASVLKISTEEAFGRRREFRELWRMWIDEFRGQEPTLLARLTLARGDIVDGIRARFEFESCRQQQVFDRAIWIERPGCEPDPTLEYGPDDCDDVLLNDGSIVDLGRRWQDWLSTNYPNLLLTKGASENG